MDESPEEEWKRDEAFFLRELEDIAVCKEKMDVVLFPVDPRLGKEYTLAGTTSRFMGFFFRIFLNNVMGSTGLGLYQLVIPLMSVCMSLCCNGFQTATSKLVAEKPQNRQIILICAIIMSATIALLLTIIMYSNA